MFFSDYSGFLHQWNIIDSVFKTALPNKQLCNFDFCLY